MIQLMGMAPFFLFLSCDYGRLLCYWIISTVFAYWIFRHDQHFLPSIVLRWSEKFQNRVSKVSFLQTPLGYTTVLLFTSCNMVGGAALGAIPIYRMIHELPFLLMSLCGISF